MKWLLSLKAGAESRKHIHSVIQDYLEKKGREKFTPSTIPPTSTKSLVVLYTLTLTEGLMCVCVSLPMLLMALHSTDVNIERGTSGVMGTTATVARLDAMCFLVSLEPGKERKRREREMTGKVVLRVRLEGTCTHRLWVYW